MIFVVGGFAAGKRDWVAAHLGYAPADFGRDVESDCPVLYDLQDLDAVDETALLGKAVVICNEVGCGLVPVDPDQRARREKTGRLCCRLARQAEAVVRVVCGVGAVIQGTLPR